MAKAPTPTPSPSAAGNEQAADEKPAVAKAQQPLKAVMTINGKILPGTIFTVEDGSKEETFADRIVTTRPVGLRKELVEELEAAVELNDVEAKLFAVDSSAAPNESDFG